MLVYHINYIITNLPTSHLKQTPLIHVSDDVTHPSDDEHMLKCLQRVWVVHLLIKNKQCVQIYISISHQLLVLRNVLDSW